MDEDVEDDQWDASRRHKQSRDEAIYGIFLDDEDPYERLPKKKLDYNKPVNFVTGKTFDPRNNQEDDEEEEKSSEKGGDEPTDDEREVPPPEQEKKRKFFVVLPTKKKGGEEEEEGPPIKKPQPEKKVNEPELAADFASFLDGTKTGRAVWAMMSKSGFRGRLGKTEQGMAEAIQVKARPQKAGLGVIDEKTEQQKRWERQIKVSKGEVVSDEEREHFGPKILGGASGAKVSRRRGGWRKSTSLKPSKAKDIEEIVGKEKREKIIDMRGPQVQLLEGLESIGVAQPQIDGSLKELRHNVHLLVKMTEFDIQALDAKLKQEQAKLSKLEREHNKFEQSQTMSSDIISQLEDLARCLAQIYEKVDALKSSAFMPGRSLPEINMTSLAKTFASLQQKFSEAYSSYDVDKISVAIALELLKKVVHFWRPLEQPAFATEALLCWRKLLNRAASGEEWYGHLIAEGVYPKIRMALQGHWDVLEAKAAVELLEEWGALFPTRFRGDLLDLVVQRLSRAVEQWDPRTATVNIHVWLHPWLPLLQRRMEDAGIYKAIRFKLGEVLRQAKWLPSDSSALHIITPWCGVFLEEDMQAFLDRYIVPALVGYMRSMEYDPARQDFAKWGHVMLWHEALSPDRLERLVVQEFFPKFKLVLKEVLHQPQPDYERIMAWYQQWHDAIPPAIKDRNSVETHWDQALDIMNAALEGDADTKQTPSDISAINQAAMQELRRERFRAEQARAISRHSYMDAERTLKEEIEEFAGHHDFLFAPKKGLAHDGKPLYSFGQVTCYMDNKVIYTQHESEWKPCSLDQLLRKAEARRKKG